MPHSHIHAHTLGAVLGMFLKEHAMFQTLSFPQVKIRHSGQYNLPSASLAFLFLNVYSSANISWMLSCLISREIHKGRKLTQEERGAVALHPPWTKPLPWHPSATLQLCHRHLTCSGFPTGPPLIYSPPSIPSQGRCEQRPGRAVPTKTPNKATPMLPWK